MTEANSSKHTRGRPRLPTPERLEHKKASQKAWVLRNHAYVKAQTFALGTRPEYRERRKELYTRKRQALLESGWVPAPRGRPRLYDENEARARQLITARDSARRTRERSRAFNEGSPELN
jgi:hypothetical protein